jgi:hypothetical protein
MALDIFGGLGVVRDAVSNLADKVAVGTAGKKDRI